MHPKCIKPKYDNFEHIVIDGGSTDKQKKFQKNTRKNTQSYFEKDNGIWDAMNKGLNASVTQIDS